MDASAGLRVDSGSMGEMSKSHLENMFAAMLRVKRIPFRREFRAIRERQFRWDFRILGQKVLVEIQGGIWKRGAHSSGTGLMRDYEKNNLAQHRGWRVYYACNTKQMQWIVEHL